MSQQPTTTYDQNELVITRKLNAPRSLVFQVWSEESHLRNWWGPAGLEWVESKLDFRPGGIFHYCMRTPEGDVMWGKFVFHEIEAPERIVFVNSFSDPEGNTVRAPFSPVFPIEVRNELLFTEEDGQTLITLRGRPINATQEELDFFNQMKDSMNQGFNGTFTQLETYLASLQ